MFLGDKEDALALHRENWGKKVLGDMTWEVPVKQDFARLCGEGLAHELMEVLDKDIAKAKACTQLLSKDSP